MNELVLGRRALLRAAALSGAGFGLAQALIVYLQVKGVAISMYFTMMLPYLLTLAALAVISTSKKPSMPEKIKVVSTGME